MKRSICGVRRGIPVNAAWRAVAPIAAPGPSRAAAQRDAARRRRARVLPVAAVAAAAGFSGGHEHRGAPRAGHAAPAVHERDAPRRHRRLAAARRHSDRARRHRRKPSRRSTSRRPCEARQPPTPSPSATRSIACGGRWRPAPRSPRCLVPSETALRAQAARDGRCRSANRVAGVAGAALARREREDAGVRGASRDARDAARDPQPAGTTGDRCVSRRRSRRRAATPRSRCFREVDGPSLLVSTECGGEGRNFEFCRRLVLFDLPWKPSVVEQRIGRLDRIGRRIPVEVVYFRPAGGIGRDVVRLFEALGLFREPLAGLEPQLAPVEGALEADRARSEGVAFRRSRFDALVGQAQAARTRIREAAYQQLHRDPYRPEMAPGILARVPKELDALNQEVVITASIGLGFTHCASARPPRVLHRARQRRDRSMAYRACRPVRATSARSIARRPSRTSSSTSSRPGIRWSKASLRTTRRAPSAAPCGSRSRWARRSTRGSIAIYKDGRAFEVVAIDVAGNATA